MVKSADIDLRDTFVDPVEPIDDDNGNGNGDYLSKVEKQGILTALRDHGIAIGQVHAVIEHLRDELRTSNVSAASTNRELRTKLQRVADEVLGIRETLKTFLESHKELATSHSELREDIRSLLEQIRLYTGKHA